MMQCSVRTNAFLIYLHAICNDSVESAVTDVLDGSVFDDQILDCQRLKEISVDFLHVAVFNGERVNESFHLSKPHGQGGNVGVVTFDVNTLFTALQALTRVKWPLRAVVFGWRIDPTLASGQAQWGQEKEHSKWPLRPRDGPWYCIHHFPKMALLRLFFLLQQRISGWQFWVEMGLDLDEWFQEDSTLFEFTNEHILCELHLHKLVFNICCFKFQTFEMRNSSKRCVVLHSSFHFSLCHFIHWLSSNLFSLWNMTVVSFSLGVFDLLLFAISNNDFSLGNDQVQTKASTDYDEVCALLYCSPRHLARALEEKKMLP